MISTFSIFSIEFEAQMAYCQKFVEDFVFYLVFLVGVKRLSQMHGVYILVCINILKF